MDERTFGTDARWPCLAACTVRSVGRSVGPLFLGWILLASGGIGGGVVLIIYGRLNLNN